MKLLLIAILVGSFGVVWAQPKPPRPTLSVIGIEAVAKTGAPAADTVAVAAEIESLVAARVASRDSPHRAVVAKQDLASLRTAAHCAHEAPFCMIDIATAVGAESILYGKVEKVGTGYQVTLTVIEALMRGLQQHVEVIEPDFATGIPLARWVEETHAKLLASRVTGVPLPPPRRAPPRAPLAPAKLPTAKSAGLPFAIVELRAVDTAPESAKFAREANAEIRAQLRKRPDYRALRTACLPDRVRCLATAGRFAGATVVLSGTVERVDGRFQVTFRVVDVAKQIQTLATTGTHATAAQVVRTIERLVPRRP